MQGKLTAAQVKALKKPGKYSDGATLYLLVAPGGSKSWTQRIVANGTLRNLGLGGYPVVSLRKAREKAFENRKLVDAGKDPLLEKRRLDVPTFAEATEKVIALHRPTWKGPGTERNWRQSLGRYVLPKHGARPVNKISQQDVLAILSPIWTGKPDLARKLRIRIRKVLGWAQSNNYIEHNAAGECIDGALIKMPAVHQHFDALDYKDVGAVLDQVDRDRHASPQSGPCALSH